MGNHAVGTAMGHAAQEAVRNRNSEETALAILDRICEPYRDSDAEFEVDSSDHEFESYTEPHKNAALGMLMVEAFAPNGIADLPKYIQMNNKRSTQGERNDAYDHWSQEVYDPFKARYDFW
jgi:hypothetical protein